MPAAPKPSGQPSQRKPSSPACRRLALARSVANLPMGLAARGGFAARSVATRLPRAQPSNGGAPERQSMPRTSGAPTDVVDPRHSASPGLVRPPADRRYSGAGSPTVARFPARQSPAPRAGTPQPEGCNASCAPPQPARSPAPPTAPFLRPGMSEKVCGSTRRPAAFCANQPRRTDTSIRASGRGRRARSGAALRSVRRAACRERRVGARG